MCGSVAQMGLPTLSKRVPSSEDTYIILNTTKRRGTAVHAIHVLPGNDERWNAAAVALVPNLESALGGSAKVTTQGSCPRNQDSRDHSHVAPRHLCVLPLLARPAMSVWQICECLRWLAGS